MRQFMSISKMLGHYFEQRYNAINILLIYILSAYVSHLIIPFTNG